MLLYSDYLSIKLAFSPFHNRIVLPSTSRGNSIGLVLSLISSVANVMICKFSSLFLGLGYNLELLFNCWSDYSVSQKNFSQFSYCRFCYLFYLAGLLIFECGLCHLFL